MDNTLRFWDVKTAQQQKIIQLLPDQEWILLDPKTKEPIACSENTWPWLGWQALTKEGKLTRLPADIYGPISEVLKDRQLHKQD